MSLKMVEKFDYQGFPKPIICKINYDVIVIFLSILKRNKKPSKWKVNLIKQSKKIIIAYDLRVTFKMILVAHFRYEWF